MWLDVAAFQKHKLTDRLTTRELPAQFIITAVLFTRFGVAASFVYYRRAHALSVPTRFGKAVFLVARSMF